MANKLSRLDLSAITGIENDIYEIDALYLGGKAASLYATQTWVEGLLVGKVDYLGVVESMDSLPTGENIGAGDFCRVKTEFDFGTEKAHVGDILIALSDNPAQSILGWDLIHNEYDWTHKHTFTPAGTVSQPTFSGTVVTSGTNSANIAVASSSHTHSTTVSGDVEITTAAPASGETANYTPAGTINAPTFTGSSATSGENSGTAVAALTGVTAALASTPTFTGTVVTSSKNSANKSVIATATMPTFTVANKVLTITAGSTTTATVAAHTHTHDVTAKGTVSKPSITVTPTTSNVAPSGHTHSVTAKGSVAAPTFTGAEVIIKGTFEDIATSGVPSATTNVAAHAHTHDVTAKGTVSKPTFTGSQGTTFEPTN